MKEIASTLTSKGQITIPVEVRRHLGLKQGDKVAFVLEDKGRVELRVPRFSSVASLAGAAGSLPEPMPMEDMVEIAREDALAGEYQKDV